MTEPDQPQPFDHHDAPDAATVDDVLGILRDAGVLELPAGQQADAIRDLAALEVAMARLTVEDIRAARISLQAALDQVDAAICEIDRLIAAAPSRDHRL